MVKYKIYEKDDYGRHIDIESDRINKSAVLKDIRVLYRAVFGKTLDLEIAKYMVAEVVRLSQIDRGRMFFKGIAVLKSKKRFGLIFGTEAGAFSALKDYISFEINFDEPIPKLVIRGNKAHPDFRSNRVVDTLYLDYNVKDDDKKTTGVVDLNKDAKDGVSFAGYIHKNRNRYTSSLEKFYTVDEKIR